MAADRALHTDCGACLKKLKDPDAGLATFLPRLETLGSTLGPILFQLPPHWRCNVERLAEFLAALPRRHRYAFELRDPSWHVSEVYRLLRWYDAAFCIFDLAGVQSALEVTASFAYVRLHGPDGAYQGSYTTTALRTWARRIAAWRRTLQAVYVYFDNDQAAFAVHNARALKRLVRAGA